MRFYSNCIIFIDFNTKLTHVSIAGGTDLVSHVPNDLNSYSGSNKLNNDLDRYNRSILKNFEDITKEWWVSLAITITQNSTEIYPWYSMIILIDLPSKSGQSW